ncbi:hypothetical protein N7471_001739 [Penicillium samsonianum]|uniref:uncharacterized protein n=1 Tax=Penicillium samsonianum TaxID=1882272 RepID=UPI0025484AF1|nr:uncharacterized protein N7471_001739 [Penicillium samsonianum]KAJ6150540.1 hypothetical protein N7471_001739 [Penicillium samsonianum]
MCESKPVPYWFDLCRNVDRVLKSRKVKDSVSQGEKKTWLEAAQMAREDGDNGYHVTIRVVEWCIWCDQEGRKWKFREPRYTWTDFQKSPWYKWIDVNSANEFP